MPYYSTDSDEHRENVESNNLHLMGDPGHDKELMDWWFDEPDDVTYRCSEDDDLDPEIEEHNDEIMERERILDNLYEDTENG